MVKKFKAHRNAKDFAKAIERVASSEQRGEVSSPQSAQEWESGERQK